jgi:hypothetical protein
VGYHFAADFAESGLAINDPDEAVFIQNHPPDRPVKAIIKALCTLLV